MLAMTIWTRGQVLRQVAIALVGDDDRRAGFGDQEIGAGDADIGGEKFRPQQRARLVAQLARLVQRPRRIELGVRGAERRLPPGF